jgi:imidazolonepropionase-like amidohydrolase
MTSAMTDEAPGRIRRALALAAGLGLASGCVPAARPGAGERPLALVGVHVLAMQGEGMLADQTLVVRNGRIEALGPRDALDVPWNAIRVEGAGRFVLPGLVDMHTHVTGGRTLRAALAHGITTVRNMRGDARHLGWRREIARGERLGPRLLTAGPQLAGRGEGAPDVVVVASAREARAAVRAQAAAGFDFVKVYEDLSRAAHRAVLEEATRLGLPVAGHVSGEVGIYATLASGQASIEHAEELTQGAGGLQPATLRALVARARGSPAWICPTLTLHRLFSPREDHAFRQRLVAALHRAGVGVLAGSDAAPAGLAQELRELVESGLTPQQALRAATAEAARFLGRGQEFGRVAVGLAADLVLVERDPLADLSVLQTPSGVVARGRWLDARSLARLAR